MSTGTTDFEALLREALTPVDPPADLVARLELTLVNLTELAQEELEAWELSAMRDPRNWVRPAAAAVVGVTAGTALVAAAGAQPPPRRASSSRRACSTWPSARCTTSPTRRGGSCPIAEPASAPVDRSTTPLLASLPVAVCYRHPNRETGVSCSSCGRPICPDCMTPTPVGMRCPECARDRTKVKTIRSGAVERRSSPRR